MPNIDIRWAWLDVAPDWLRLLYSSTYTQPAAATPPAHKPLLRFDTRHFHEHICLGAKRILFFCWFAKFLKVFGTLDRSQLYRANLTHILQISLGVAGTLYKIHTMKNHEEQLNNNKSTTTIATTTTTATTYWKILEILMLNMISTEHDHWSPVQCHMCRKVTHPGVHHHHDC